MTICCIRITNAALGNKFDSVIKMVKFNPVSSFEISKMSYLNDLGQRWSMNYLCFGLL